METKLVHLPFIAGLEQKKDVVALDPPELPTILNYQFSKDGALDSRSGFVSQSTTLIACGQIEAPAAMAEANGELLAVSSVTQANLYGATDPLVGWVQKGTAVEWLATKYWAANRVFAETTPITQVFDLAVVGGQVWCVSAYGAEVTLCAYDQDTLALKWSGTTFTGLSSDAVTAVRLCAFNGALFVGLQQDAINLLSVYKVTPATFAIAAWHTYASNQRWVDIKAASDRMIVAHWNGAAVELLQYDTSFALVGNKTIASLNGADNLIVAVGAVGEYVYALWFDATLGNLYVWGDILLSSGVAPLIIALGVLIDTIAAVKVAADKVYTVVTVTAGGAIASRGGTFQGPTPAPVVVGYSDVADVVPAANLFTENGVNYCPMFPTLARAGWIDNGQVDSAYVLHDITHYSVSAVPRICGTLSPRDAARAAEQVRSSGKCMLPNVPQIQAGVRVAAVQQVDGSIALYVLDSRNVSTNPRYQRTQVADTLLFNGAMPVEYDGVQPYEYGFVRAPSIKATAHGAGSGTMTGGQYFYTATYVWRDGHGNIVQSPVGGLGTGSGGVQVTVVANGSAEISWTPLSTGVTRKYRDQGSLWNPEIWIYRNEPGAVAYYLAHVVEMTASMSGTVQTWTDTQPNGYYTTNGLLYTSGDVLEDQLPPAFTVVVAHRNRLFGADKTNLWYTKSYVANSLPGFNDIFILPIDEGGDITALASMDSSLIVFKRDRIFAVAGDGPTDNGSNNDLNTQRVAAQNGCISPRSVVVTTWGVFFQAEDGVYMLGRDMSLSYIGAPAEISLSASPIVAAHYLSGTAQVAFVLSTNITCVYDMTFQRWTIFRPFQTCASACATAYEGELVMGGDSTGAAVVLRLTDGATSDDGAGIRGVFVTAWVKTGGIQGFQRVRRIMLYGTVIADASVEVKLEFDYATTNAQVETWTSAQIASLKADGRIQLEVQPQYQKCESFRVTVTENAGSGTGRGITWESVMLECGLKASRFKGLADGARK